MKKNSLFLVTCLFLVFALFTQCEKGGHGMLPLSDDDSDRPNWAQGNNELNDHINKNDQSGTTRGGDYGDLFALLRDVNGVPVLTEITGEYYVQPVGVDGLPLQLDAEGELVDAELATEVEFGRLNIVRSPQDILDMAFEEAMTVLEAPGAVISLDFGGRLTSTYPDPVTGEIIVKTIDSPRENMALYQRIMNESFEVTATNRLAFLGESPYRFDPMLIAASCFAAGSDKSGTVKLDEVVYTNGFLDCTGLNPILNEHEFDSQNNEKYYFNFGDCYCDSLKAFEYNRQKVYQNRRIQFLVWDNIYYPINEDGSCDGPIFTILEYMEGLIDGISKFTYEWNDIPETHVEGFTVAIDDAVQVIDLVHGDSNIRFLP